MSDITVKQAPVSSSLTPLNQTGKQAELAEVADQFEALFLNHLLQQARKTKLADDLFSNPAKEQYEQMLDTEYASQLSGEVNLGVAEALLRQFGKYTS